MDDHVDFLKAALIGYECEKAKIEGLIAALHLRLGHSAPERVVQAHKKRHRISPEGVERIRAAQKKRWAAKKRQKAA